MIRMTVVSLVFMLTIGMIGGAFAFSDDDAKPEKAEHKVNPRIMRGPGPVITEEALKNAPWTVSDKVEKEAREVFDRCMQDKKDDTSFTPIAVAVQVVGIKRYCFICITKETGEKAKMGFASVYIIQGMGVAPRIENISKIDLQKRKHDKPNGDMKKKDKKDKKDFKDKKDKKDKD